MFFLSIKKEINDERCASFINNSHVIVDMYVVNEIYIWKCTESKHHFNDQLTIVWS